MPEYEEVEVPVELMMVLPELEEMPMPKCEDVPVELMMVLLLLEYTLMP